MINNPVQLRVRTDITLLSVSYMTMLKLTGVKSPSPTAWLRGEGNVEWNTSVTQDCTHKSLFVIWAFSCHEMLGSA